MDAKEPCIFCQIVQGSSPAQIEYRDANCVVFWDIQPHAPVHLLVTSTKHLPSLRDAMPDDAQLLGKMLLTAQEIAKRKGFADEGYRVVINTGENGGQAVDHIHLHILAGARLGTMTSAKNMSYEV